MAEPEPAAERRPLAGERGGEARDAPGGGAQQRGGEQGAAGELGPADRGVGLHGGGRPDPGQDRRDGDDRHPRRYRQRLDRPPEHPHRRHPEHGAQGGQAEEQRDADAQQHAAEHRRRLERVDQVGRHQAGGEARDGQLDADAEGRADQAAEEPQERDLAGVDQGHLPRAQADALEHRHRVQPSGQPGPHRLADADAADQERQQRHQPEESLRAGQTPPQGRLGLGPGLDPVDVRGEGGADRPGPGLGRLPRRPVRQGDQGLVADPAAGGLEAGAVEQLRPDEQPRPGREPERAAQRVRLALDHSRHPCRQPAEPEPVPDRQPQVLQQLRRRHHGVAGKKLRQRPIGPRDQVAVERIRPVDHLQLDQLRSGRPGRRSGGRVRPRPEGVEARARVGLRGTALVRRGPSRGAS